MGKNIDELIRLVTEAGGQVTFYGKPVTADELRDKVVDSMTRRLTKMLTHRCEKFNDGNRCTVCQLPIGIPCEPEPANDTPEVMVELRAAELAALGDEWWDAREYESESYGVLCFHNGGTPGDDDDGGCSDYADAEWAGYLARCIATTEDE